MCACVFVCVCLRVYESTYIRMWCVPCVWRGLTYSHTFIYIRIYAHTRKIHIYTQIHTCIHAFSHLIYTYLYVYIYVYIYVYLYVFTYMYTYIHIYIRICIHLIYAAHTAILDRSIMMSSTTAPRRSSDGATADVLLHSQDVLIHSQHSLSTDKISGLPLPGQHTSSSSWNGRTPGAQSRAREHSPRMKFTDTPRLNADNQRHGVLREEGLREDHLNLQLSGLTMKTERKTVLQRSGVHDFSKFKSSPFDVHLESRAGSLHTEHLSLVHPVSDITEESHSNSDGTRHGGRDSYRDCQNTIQSSGGVGKGGEVGHSDSVSSVRARQKTAVTRSPDYDSLTSTISGSVNGASGQISQKSSQRLFI